MRACACACACACASVPDRHTHRYTERMRTVQKNGGQIVLSMVRAAKVPTRHPCVFVCKNRPKGCI